MRSKPLIIRDLILSPSKDEATDLCFFSILLLRRPGPFEVSMRHASLLSSFYELDRNGHQDIHGPGL